MASSVFFVMIRPPPGSTLLPYTTLFRSALSLLLVLLCDFYYFAYCVVYGMLVADAIRSEEHTSELQSQFQLVCRLLLVKTTKQVKHGATSKSTSNTTRRSTKAKSPHLSG